MSRTGGNKNTLETEARIILQYPEETNRRNYDSLFNCAKYGGMLLFIYTVASLLFSHELKFNYEFWILLGYFVTMYLFARYSSWCRDHATLCIYLWLSPIMMTGVLMGSVLDPNTNAITVIVTICVLPLMILDQPEHVMIFTGVWAAVFLLFSHACKSTALFNVDLINTAMFTLLGLLMDRLILKDRIASVEDAMKLKHISEIDSLTDVLTRRAGVESARLLMLQGKGGMLVEMDIDDFKRINDTYGHDMGDHVLRFAARCLKDSFRRQDVIMRLGGDEFMVYADSLTDQDMGIERVNGLLERIQGMVFAELGDQKISISVGVTFCSAACNKDFETAYKEADKALYQAKKKKNCYSIYREDGPKYTL